MSKSKLPVLSPIKISKVSLGQILLVCEVKDNYLISPQIGEVVFNTDEHVEIKTQKKFSKKHMKKFYGVKWIAYKANLGQNK